MKVLTKEEYELLREECEIKQFAYCLFRKDTLRKQWRCRCGKMLPITGSIWEHRFGDFVDEYFFADVDVVVEYSCDITN